MRRAAFAIALMASTVSAKADTCGNWAFNIVRASECISYTNDSQKQRDLRDKRLDAMGDFTQHNPAGGAALQMMMLEGDRRMTNALARDLALWPDEQMYKSRGCAELPVCVATVRDSVDVPRKVQTIPVAPVRRNTRTGGKWCGPIDRSHGYCNWNGWLK